jgi:hypothetical protein
MERPLEDDLHVGAWRKARRSIANGECVEVAPVADAGNVAVRDSTDPDGPILQYSVVSWRTFLTTAKSGTFDI